MTKIGIENPTYVHQKKALWAAQGCKEPLSMTVVEFHGDGDPAFGGRADDRPLGPDQMILDRMSRYSIKPVEFLTIEAAHEAAKAIKNRRADSILGICPVWR